MGLEFYYVNDAKKEIIELGKGYFISHAIHALSPEEWRSRFAVIGAVMDGISGESDVSYWVSVANKIWEFHDVSTPSNMRLINDGMEGEKRLLINQLLEDDGYRQVWTRYVEKC